MTTNAQITAGNEPTLPSRWTAEVEPQLAAGEKLQAWVEIDLDNRLQFADGLVIATNQRLLARAPGETQWQHWPLHTGLKLNHLDHAGVGTLELLDAQGRLACWRYTLGHNLAALRVITEVEQQLESLRTGRPVERSQDEFCPKCKAPLEPGQDECPICTHETATPPSTWTLFRLGRFAKPYKWQLLAGCLRALASTAASLVAPYLTMPLMDNILYVSYTHLDVYKRQL